MPFLKRFCFVWVYQILPVFIVYLPLPSGLAGVGLGPLVLIKTRYYGDKGLLEHELEHCRQAYSLPILHYVFYLISQTYRYHVELKAYRIQLKYCTNNHDSAIKFSRFLANNYFLPVTSHRAYTDLTKKDA